MGTATRLWHWLHVPGSAGVVCSSQVRSVPMSAAARSSTVSTQLPAVDCPLNADSGVTGLTGPLSHGLLLAHTPSGTTDAASSKVRSILSPPHPNPDPL